MDELEEFINKINDHMLFVSGLTQEGLDLALSSGDIISGEEW